MADSVRYQRAFAQKGKHADYPAADAERDNACNNDRSVVTGLECKDYEGLFEH